jgi:hypothetical protein
MNAVWQHSRSEGRARLVLLAIADHQGEIGAWPSLERLAEMTNASVRSVQRDIQVLEALGELKVERQSAPTRSQYRANLYWVTLPGLDDSGVTAGVTNAPSGVTNAPSGVTAGGILTLIEPLEETNNRNALFDEFWKEYPLRKDKGKAVKAFRSALTRAKFEQIIAGVIAYKSDPTRKPEFTKYPATWLNSDSWENEIAPSPDSEAAERARLRKERERAESQAFLAEQRAMQSNATGPTLCEHGLTIARCLPCAKSLDV